MKVLLAGGTGVLGRATVPRLVAAGHDVTVVSRRAESDGRLQAAGARPIRLDIFDREAAGSAAHDVDAVVNLATSIPTERGASAARLSTWEPNDRLRGDASRVLAEAAVAAGARFVQESFAPTYGDHGSAWITEEAPLDPVAQTATVVDAEASAALVTSKGGTGVVLRFGLFYGPGSGQSRQMLHAARRGWFLLPGPPDRYSSMIFVEDAAAAVVSALALPAGTYNVVEDEPMTRGAHAAVLAELLGRRRVRLLPAAVGRVPVLQALARSHRIRNQRLRDASDWRPVAPSVREGWSRTLAELATRDNR